ncbi:MAG: hypothetical protein AAB631_00500 [Patescibacteria group bacterium]
MKIPRSLFGIPIGEFVPAICILIMVVGFSIAFSEAFEKRNIAISTTTSQVKMVK